MSADLIVLVGMPGSGKTAVGQELARGHGCSWVDSDHLIEDKVGSSCGDFLRAVGESRFREVEAEVIVDALESRSGVLSLGGGAVTTPATRKLLSHVPVVWLEVSVDEGVRRADDGTRPLLAVADPRAAYQQLAEQRHPLFAEVADVRVDTTGLSVAEIARRIESELAVSTKEENPTVATTTIPVQTAQPYDVHVGFGLTGDLARFVASELKAKKVGVVFQPSLANVAGELIAAVDSAGVQAHPIEIPDAEAGKTIDSLSTVWDACADVELTRSDLLLGVGGGAATDLAGFAAATWMRGIKVVQVPTSLLGMVDAAVGGKTGINTAAGKNLVGAFHEPAGVYVDLNYLCTLPETELTSGLAEIIKCGFIGDPWILELVEADPAAARRVEGTLPELIVRAIGLKARVVSQDLKESSQREILNYGHTFGHAIEQSEEFRWRHGNAVAVGMVFVAELARSRGLIEQKLVDKHRKILRSVGLPISYSGAAPEHLIDVMRRDKKVRDGQIRFVALNGEPGRVTRIEDAREEELKAMIAAIAKD